MTSFLAPVNRFLFRYADLILLTILSFSIPLFLYKLGQSSLVSWDEAWYAEIARNILKTGDVFHLIYNESLFADKPPGGMWMTAIFFKLFGVSAFTARISSAISGVLCLYFIYLLGSKLFNRLVGFCSAVSLLSSYWFLYRSRSGNLDAPLVLFYILTVYLAIRASENKKYLIPFVLSLGYLALIKGIVFMAILLPVILIIFWKNKIYKIRDLIFALALSFGLFGLWIVLQASQDPSQAWYHFTHSLRESSLENDYFKNFDLFKQYLHQGIGKWFWPGVLGGVMGLFFFQRRFYILSVLCIVFSLPFIFSPKVEIWHLIPLYPFMILEFYGAFYEVGKRILNLVKLRVSYKNLILIFALLSFALYFSFMQLRAAWYQFIDIPAFISDEEILASEAGRNKGKIYLDGDFDPAGAFYANRVVTKLNDSNINNLFAQDVDFLLITNDWRLEQAKIDPSKYILLKKDRDKVLIQRKISNK